MVRSVAGDLPEQVKNNQSVNMAAGNGGQEISQYSWFTVYCESDFLHKNKTTGYIADDLIILSLSILEMTIYLTHIPQKVSSETYYLKRNASVLPRDCREAYR